MVQNIKRVIGARLRASRLARGLTQEQLAERVEKSVQTLSAIERGKYLPAFDTLLGLAAALGVPLHTLLVEGSDGPTRRDQKEFEALMILRQLKDADLDLAIAQLRAFLIRD